MGCNYNSNAVMDINTYSKFVTTTLVMPEGRGCLYDYLTRELGNLNSQINGNRNHHNQTAAAISDLKSFVANSISDLSSRIARLESANEKRKSEVIAEINTIAGLGNRPTSFKVKWQNPDGFSKDVDINCKDVYHLMESIMKNLFSFVDEAIGLGDRQNKASFPLVNAETDTKRDNYASKQSLRELIINQDKENSNFQLEVVKKYLFWLRTLNPKELKMHNIHTWIETNKTNVVNSMKDFEAKFLVHDKKMDAVLLALNIDVGKIKIELVNASNLNIKRQVDVMSDQLRLYKQEQVNLLQAIANKEDQIRKLQEKSKSEIEALNNRIRYLEERLTGVKTEEPGEFLDMLEAKESDGESEYHYSETESELQSEDDDQEKLLQSINHRGT
ncbi:uncharacterized protein LOC116266859 [Nymphaea colorata]|uniref:uncharacterized protein LOC116266859 n=1 Tax=Nymphaea colorata TaxID=210225 RepID=UPI00129E5D6A|nr:uncharacterized protein LOC116266859 [Nymphaea colorata]XP_031504165.1 uncharacterized protein LOC116266859 [Nymphaea colorata]